jgi:hypothetical protein
MKSDIKYVVPNDAPVPVGTTIGSSTVADWLGSDIQYSTKTAKEWLNIFNEVIDGKREPGYQGTGNTHSVMVIDNWVYIECEYREDQKVFMSVEQAIIALEKYKSFLDNRVNFAYQVPSPFEVEYEAEGQEALDRYLETGGSLGE